LFAFHPLSPVPIERRVEIPALKAVAAADSLDFAAWLRAVSLRRKVPG
jgi:hypothetical protein